MFFLRFSQMTIPSPIPSLASGLGFAQAAPAPSQDQRLARAVHRPANQPGAD
jgi:hypothetical protein